MSRREKGSSLSSWVATCEIFFTPASSNTQKLFYYSHSPQDRLPSMDVRFCRIIIDHEPTARPHRRNYDKKEMDARLYYAAVNGSVDVIGEYGCSLTSQLTVTGNTVLHLTVGVPAACHCSIAKIQFIETVLDHQKSLLVQKNNNGEIPLHLAARFGHVKAVEVFISRATRMGGNCLREMLMTTDRKEDTALHHAARWNNVQIVELLLNAGRDCRYVRNADGQTPLYLAAERKHSKVVAVMLEDCKSPAYEGPHGRTALHVAVLHEDEGMVNQILEKNKALVRSQDDGGQTPLHYAAGFKGRTEGPIQCLKVLLQYDATSDDSAVYIQDSEGRTALHLAVLYGDVQRVEALIEHRPDCSEIRDDKGWNLLHFAAKYKCRETIEYLWRKGIFDKLFNEQDKEGNTPLHLLANSFTPHGPLFYWQSLRPFIKDRYVDPMVFNSQNQTAADILQSRFPSESIPIPRSIYRLAPRDVLTPSRKEPKKCQLAGCDKEENSEASCLKKSSEAHMIVATLIATVSFAAGIAVPGGFNQDPGADQGTALLTRQTTFRVFMVSDALSLALSAAAMLLNFFIVSTKNERRLRFCYRISFTATSLSIGTMMVAFMTGTYATTYQSPSFAAMILVFPALFMFFHALYLLAIATGTIKFCESQE